MLEKRPDFALQDAAACYLTLTLHISLDGLDTICPASARLQL
jgi:hypothetical protein